MSEDNNLERGAERRRKIAEMKIWGAVIETIERARKHPEILSVMHRLTTLYEEVYKFHQAVKKMGADLIKKGGDPLKTLASTFTTEQTNIYIEVYNDIIEDMH